MSILENVLRIKNEIVGVTLLAASKTQTAEAIMAAAKTPIDAFGENKVQELVFNFERNAYFPKPLHFIGKLQSNKVKYLIGKVELIHSVDSLKLASEIDKQAEKNALIQSILIETNIGCELSKGGIMPNELDNFLNNLSGFKNLLVKGLMTIPPQENTRKYFKEMRKLNENYNFPILSMGMTHDYMDAIAEGSNIIRIGTGIFGERE